MHDRLQGEDFSNLTLPESRLLSTPWNLNPKENLWDEIREKIFKNYALKSIVKTWTRFDGHCPMKSQLAIHLGGEFGERSTVVNDHDRLRRRPERPSLTTMDPLADNFRRDEWQDLTLSAGSNSDFYKSIDAVRAKLKQAIVYIERNPETVKSITSFPYILKSL